MTVTAAYWLFDQAETELEKAVSAPAALFVLGSPYHALGKAAQTLDDINYWSRAAAVNRSHHAYMVKHGMSISASSARSFAQTAGRFAPGARPGFYPPRILRGRGARLAAKVAGRFVPGLGWALFAYDVYTVGNMIFD